jgi:hypothetical protein
MTTDPPPESEPNYRNANATGQQELEERPGCLDVLAATAGMGCALAVRGVIILAGLIILYVLLRYATAGGGQSGHPTPTPAALIFWQGLDRRALVLLYLVHLEEKLGGRVMDQIHARVHLLCQFESLFSRKALHHHLHDGECHLAQREEGLIAMNSLFEIGLSDRAQPELTKNVNEQSGFYSVTGEKRD